ncbi:MAG: beta-lactamase [Myxococcales bacterium]|nr:beta-lactamase [Myxococcales bacterium]
MRTLVAVVSSLLFVAAAHAGPNDAAPAAGKAADKTAPAAGKTKITWYGHAAFRIDTPTGKVLLVDPWIDNPVNKANAAADLAGLTAVDLILVTHGHFDHVGNAADIAKKTKAKLVATFDLGNALVANAGYPKELFGMDTGGNFGGTIEMLGGDVAITYVPAIHSSGVGDKDAYGGNPGGFVIAVKNGPTIYHTGDTDVYGDMATIGKFAKIDLMLACIGDHFTMGPDRAAEAVRLVKPKQVVPMHFGTFPILTGTPAELGKALKKAGSTTKLVEMKVGTSITL